MSYTLGSINHVNIMLTPVENGISRKIYNLNTSDGNITVIDSGNRDIFKKCLNSKGTIKFANISNLEKDEKNKKPKIIKGLKKINRDTENISAVIFMDGQHANMTDGVLAFIDDKQIE